MAWLATLALGGAMSSGAVAQADRPVITWYLSNFPPAFIQEGPDSGDGYGDRLLRRVMARLPGYEHRLVDVTVVRAVRDIAEGKDACYPIAIRTPDRDAVAYFTPWALVNGMRLAVTAEVAARHSADLAEPVDLDRLLSARQLNGVVNTGRSYTPELDAILAAHAGSPMLKTIAVTPANRSDALEVLAAGRVDFTLELTWRTDYVLRRAGIDPGRVVLRRLSAAAPWFMGQVMCPRTPWGQERITAIDAAIRSLAADPSYRAEVEQWMRVDSDAAFAAASRDFYRQRAAEAMHTVEGD